MQLGFVRHRIFKNFHVLVLAAARGSKKLIGKLPINYLADQLINCHCCLFAIIIAINRN